LPLISSEEVYAAVTLNIKPGSGDWAMGTQN